MFQLPTPRRTRQMARQVLIAQDAQLSPATEIPVDETDTTAAASDPTKGPSKISIVLDLLQRAEGATLDEIVAATGWLAHSARAALTGLRKKGHSLTSRKPEFGPRIYHVGAQPEAAGGEAAA